MNTIYRTSAIITNPKKPLRCKLGFHKINLIREHIRVPNLSIVYIGVSKVIKRCYLCDYVTVIWPAGFPRDD